MDVFRNDVKPGLTFNRGTKRKNELEMKKKLVDPKKRILSESEARTSGLEKPIEETNKGFQLLQKMGFKAEERMKKPIPIEIKTGRSGLGKESAEVQKLLDIESGRLKQFKDKTNLTITERWAIKDLKSSQKSCFNLDSEMEIENPVKEHFWPHKVINERKLRNTEEEESEAVEEMEDENLVDTAKKLEEVTIYLRNFHKFCIWCGIKFESMEDMEENCPGNDRVLHSDLL